jgi:hypothetical protein
MEKPLVRKIETIEKAEFLARFKTLSIDIIRRATEESDEIIAVTECDGTQHRRALEETTYDTDGSILFVVEHEREIIGACDCK